VRPKSPQTPIFTGETAHLGQRLRSLRSCVCVCLVKSGLRAPLPVGAPCYNFITALEVGGVLGRQIALVSLLCASSVWWVGDGVDLCGSCGVSREVAVEAVLCRGGVARVAFIM
jgi:hypothetical protein